MEANNKLFRSILINAKKLPEFIEAVRGYFIQDNMMEEEQQ